MRPFPRVLASCPLSTDCATLRSHSYHIYGLVVILHHSLYQNTPVVVHAKFEPRAFLQSIQDHRITTLYLVPPQVIFMVKQDELVRQFDLSSVRMVMAGAAPLTDEARLTPGGPCTTALADGDAPCRPSHSSASASRTFRSGKATA